MSPGWSRPAEEYFNQHSLGKVTEVSALDLSPSCTVTERFRQYAVTTEDLSTQEWFPFWWSFSQYQARSFTKIFTLVYFVAWSDIGFWLSIPGFTWPLCFWKARLPMSLINNWVCFFKQWSLFWFSSIFVWEDFLKTYLFYAYAYVCLSYIFASYFVWVLLEARRKGNQILLNWSYK